MVIGCTSHELLDKERTFRAHVQSVKQWDRTAHDVWEQTIHILFSYFLYVLSCKLAE